MSDLLRPDLRGTVVDSWWPERYGKIVKRLKTRLHVKWSDGEVWVYDRPHAKFLTKPGKSNVR